MQPSTARTRLQKMVLDNSIKIKVEQILGLTDKGGGADVQKICHALYPELCKKNTRLDALKKLIDIFNENTSAQGIRLTLQMSPDAKRIWFGEPATGPQAAPGFSWGFLSRWKTVFAFIMYFF